MEKLLTFLMLLSIMGIWCLVNPFGESHRLRFGRTCYRYQMTVARKWWAVMLIATGAYLALLATMLLQIRAATIIFFVAVFFSLIHPFIAYALLFTTYRSLSLGMIVCEKGLLLRWNSPKWSKVCDVRWSPDGMTLNVRILTFFSPCQVVHIPADMTEEITAVLGHFIDVHAADGTLLASPNDGAPIPPALKTKPVGRFQYSLRGLLLFVVLLSPPAAWVGMQIRRETEFQTALRAVERFEPQIGRHGRRVWSIDFSQCSTRPVDDDLVWLKGSVFYTLRSLNLTDCPITDAGLRHIEGLPALKTLDLRGTQVTAEGVAELKRRGVEVLLDDP